MRTCIIPRQYIDYNIDYLVLSDCSSLSDSTSETESMMHEVDQTLSLNSSAAQPPCQILATDQRTY